MDSFIEAFDQIANIRVMLVPSMIGLILFLQGYVAVTEKQFLPAYAPRTLNLLNRDTLSPTYRANISVVTGSMSMVSGSSLILGLLLTALTPLTALATLMGLLGLGVFLLLFLIYTFLL